MLAIKCLHLVLAFRILKFQCILHDSRSSSLADDTVQKAHAAAHGFGKSEAAQEKNVGGDFLFFLFLSCGGNDASGFVSACYTQACVS